MQVFTIGAMQARGNNKAWRRIPFGRDEGVHKGCFVQAEAVGPG